MTNAGLVALNVENAAAVARHDSDSFALLFWGGDLFGWVVVATFPRRLDAYKAMMRAKF